jgi:NAD(P)-dependent dehydrogenase (short-subunit alcohol dehydrogenase family)
LFDLNLKDKVAIVTGSTGGGIGTEIAKSLLSEGAKVIINGKNYKQIKNIIDNLPEEHKENAWGYTADIRNSLEVKEMVNQVIQKHNRIDILVNNAANGGMSQRIYDINQDDWDIEIQTTLFGSFICCKYIVPHMIRQKYGKIVMVSSSAAYRGTWGRNVAYSSAKAGIIGLSKQLALELAEHNINVNVVVPSQIDTPRVKRNGRKDQDSFRQHAQNIPLGRIGKPQDVSNAVIFLVSDVSSYITGKEFFIDGGGTLASKTTGIKELYNNEEKYI